jgi:hypothetical protein
VQGTFPNDRANVGMDINSDLAYGYDTDAELAYHYQGTIRKLLSDDGLAWLYYVENPDGTVTGYGAAWESNTTWVDQDTLSSGQMAWGGGRMAWGGGRMAWGGGLSIASGRMAWGGGRMAWGGGIRWANNPSVAANAPTWADSVNPSATNISSTAWVEDW